MKYTLIFLLSTTAAFAQQNLVNGNFEDTLTIRNHSDSSSRSWTRTDFGSGTTTDAHSGTSAVYIWNWYYYAHGELTNGSPTFSGGGGGASINFSPTELTGYYKYIAGEVDTENDSAVAIVCLTVYNESLSRRDTVGYGMKKFGFVSDYTAFSVDISYQSGIAPDTVTVKFISSENGFCANASAGNCLFLYIDEIALKDAATGIGRVVSFQDALKISPNPAADKIFITGNTLPGKAVASVYNNLGEKVMEAMVTGVASYFDISALSRGVYFIRMNDRVGRFVKE